MSRRSPPRLRESHGLGPLPKFPFLLFFVFNRFCSHSTSFAVDPIFGWPFMVCILGKIYNLLRSEECPSLILLQSRRVIHINSSPLSGNSTINHMPDHVIFISLHIIVSNLDPAAIESSLHTSYPWPRSTPRTRDTRSGPNTDVNIASCLPL